MGRRRWEEERRRWKKGEKKMGGETLKNYLMMHTWSVLTKQFVFSTQYYIALLNLQSLPLTTQQGR